MAASRISAFKWDHFLARAESAEATKALNVLRNRTNEILTQHSKYSAPPTPINFSDYKKKLQFTSSAVDALEKVYAARKLPTYTATVPSFEAKKRAALLAMTDFLVASVKEDVPAVQGEIDEMNAGRVTLDTSINEFANYNPEIVQEVQDYLKDFRYAEPRVQPAHDDHH